MNKVFLDDLPRKKEGGVQIDWKNCIGASVKYVYKNIEGHFEIIRYDSPNNMLDIKINNQIIKCATNQLRRCPFGYALGYKTTKYKFNIGDIFNNMLILEQKRVPHGKNRHGNPRSEKGYKYKCLTCGGETDIYEYQLTSKINCPICCNRVIIKGINDIATTHPELAKYFCNIEDAYICSYSSPSEFDMKCVDCGYEKIMSPNMLSRNGFGCQICSDGVSFPEKFVANALTQLDINFEREKSFDWSQGKRYDFYIPDLHCILETHGAHHYKKIKHYKRTLKEEIENDRFKKEICANNGIKLYIVLDCRESSMEWIKNSIEQSELSKLIDIKKIDWNTCKLAAMNSLVIEACKLYNSGTTKTIEIANILKISQVTAIDYLHKGNKLGLCNYNPQDNARQEFLFKWNKQFTSDWRNGSMKDERIVQVYDNGTWIEIDFEKIKEGDKFRLFQDGEQVINPKGQKEFIASSSPFINQYGDLVVNIY